MQPRRVGDKPQYGQRRNGRGPHRKHKRASRGTAGANSNQVVAAWVKEGVANPSGSFPASAQALQADLEVIAQNLKINFPQIRLAYFSSRIYAGGFAVKWAIQNQIDGIALNFDPSKDAAIAPWIAWGPYLWANGLLPRSDGAVWACQDLQPDGTHPSLSGREKVSKALIQFSKSIRQAHRGF